MAANIIVAAAIIILALVGAALPDRKKEALEPDTWPDWEKKTSPMEQDVEVAAIHRARPLY